MDGEVAIFLTLLAAVLASPLSEPHSWYVEPAGGEACPPNVTCHNLSYYTRQPSLYFTSNSTFFFLSGSHVLEQPELVVVCNVNKLTLQGMGEMEEGFHWTVQQSNVRLSCSGGRGGIAFINVSELTIRNLTMFECGAGFTNVLNPYFTGLTIFQIHANKKYYYFLNRTSGSLLFLMVDRLLLEHLSVQNCSGFGLLTVDIVNTSVSSSFFSRNNLFTSNSRDCVHQFCCGGNVAFVFLSNKNATLSVTSTFVSFGARCNSGVSTNRTNPLQGLSILQLSQEQLEVKFNSVFSYLNQVNNVDISVSHSVINIENLTVAKWSHSKFEHSAFSYRVNPITTSISVRNDLFISNSKFFNNTGSAVMVHLDHVNGPTLMSIDNCSFYCNRGYYGSAIYLPSKNNPFITFIMKNSTFRENWPSNQTGNWGALNCSAISVSTFSNLTIINCSFLDNFCVGLQASSSHIFFHGVVKFWRNSGSYGGGLALYHSSTINFAPDSLVSFINNSAQYGGAIFAEDIVETKCFIKPPSTKYVHFSKNFIFSGNSAKVTGSILYGGRLCECRTCSGCDSGEKVFSQLLQDKNITGHLAVSSNPVRVCSCHGDLLDCKSKEIYFPSHYPGEIINISLVAVGQLDGFTPATASYMIGGKKMYQELPHPQCTNVTIKMPARWSIKKRLKIHFKIEHPICFKRGSIFVIPVADCPPGFSLNKVGLCECNPVIRAIGRSPRCYPDSGEIFHPPNMWFGYDSALNCTIVITQCPFDYCTHDSVTFNILQPDPQCVYHRSGILCGACSPGLSLQLGSNRCTSCSSVYLALLPVFGVAGVVLVVLLIALNLTVSMGTVNGLIFYANIVKVNEPIFFPNGPISFISQFISWLNLDFGFEVCFYNGMTPYEKLWLQFVFPLYIWLLVIVIIVVSHYSSRLSRLVGNNAVPVLATLFLLSYTKIIQTVIMGLLMAEIPCTGDVNKTDLVWLVDANVPYFGIAHSLMFVVCTLILIFIAVPYTLMLVFLPLIEFRLARIRRFSWLNRLKPLFDAYGGPYVDRYRFWTGLMLLIRLMILLVFLFCSSKVVLITITTTVHILAIMQVNLGRVYRKLFVGILESWFLLLVGGQAIVGLARLTDVGTVVFSGMAALTFIIILFCHLVLKLMEGHCLRGNTWIQLRLKRGTTGNRALVRFDEEEDDESVLAREPLLFDSLNQED